MFKRNPTLRALALGAGGAAGLIVSPIVLGQEAQPPSERIEVTGSLIRRVEAETALPVQVITKDQIERLGATNAEQLLTNLTSSSGVGGFVAAQGAGLSTFGQSAVSLRALGAQRTLVLINGRRMADFPGAATSATATSFDINAIPTAAIERIEILEDGASSIYGSEAVAGVVNVILRQSYKGIEGSVYLGTPTRTGGGQVEKAGVVGGWGDYDADRYNVMLSIDGEHNKALYGRDRNFSGQSWDSVLYDVSATPSGQIAGAWTPGVGVANQPVHGTPGYGSANDPYSCGLAGPGIGLDPNWGFGNPNGFFGPGVNPPGFARLPNAAAGTCRFNPAPLVPLIPTVDRTNALARINFKLNDSTKLFAELIYTHTKTDTLEQPSPYNFSFFETDTAFKNPTLNPAGPNFVDPTFLIKPSNYYYQNILVPFGAAHPGWAGNALIASGLPLSVSLRAFDGGGRDHTDAADQHRFSLGAIGSVADFDYDVTLANNKSRIEEDTINGYQLQLPLARLLNSSQGSTPDTAWNPWGNPQPAAIAAGIRKTNYDGMVIKADIETNSFDAKASRAVFDLPGGPLSAALGVTTRREDISIESSAPAQLGDISGYGAPIIPFSNGRSVYAGYGEIDAPIIKMIELDLAVRTDKYTGTGTNTSPKASLRFQPSSQLLLRGSVGKGFRAPSLAELFTPAFLGTSAIITDPVTGTRGQFNQTFGGNPNLRPEKSTQDSFGFVFEPVKGVSLSVDFFAVRIENSIGTLSVSETLGLAAAGNPIAVSKVHRDAAGNLIFVDTTNLNLGNLAASGEEVNARWRSPEFGIGHVTTTLTGTYMNRYDQNLPDGTVEGSVATTLNPAGSVISAIGNNGGVIQRWRHNLEFVLERQSWQVSLLQHFQTGYADVTDNSGRPHEVGAFSTWDAQVASQLTKDFRVSLGLKNIFDLNPPAVGPGFFFQTGYDPTYYDARARFVYGTMSYKFK